MSFSLATGIKLILPIKTVAYDQRSSVSRLRKDFKSLFSQWLSNQRTDIKIIQSKTTGISKRTSNKELQALQEA